MPYPTRSSVRGLADEIAAGRLDPAGRADEALRQFDADTACEVLLAAAVAGLPPPAQLVARVVPDLSDIELLPPLVGACGGDRVEMLLDCVGSDRMSSERDALALFLAVQLLEGPAPPRLSTLVRLQARRRLGVEASILLALAAKELRDPQVLEVAKNWLPMANVVEARPLRERLRRLLSAPILDALEERAPTRGVSGFTVRRAVPKVGRNDPCHCGSGKKYKKCCEATDAARAADPSPQAGLTRPEYLRTSGATMSADEVDGLRPSDLAEVDFAALRTRPLIAAVRRASLFHRWDLAERAMDVLAARTDPPDGADAEGCRLDLISDLLQAGEFAGAERQMGLLRDGTSMPASDLLKLELHRPSDRTLAYLEDLAVRGLREPHGDGLLDLSFGLLAASPALGILTARASLSLPRAIDSMMLLDVIEEARDRLALPPGDPSRDTFELLLDRDAARRVDDLGKRKESERSQKLADEADALRAKLNESKARVAELERGLRAQETTLRELPAVPSPSEPAPVTIVEDVERRRLRAKVDELKHMLMERNQERSRLRRELARVNETLATDAAGSSDAPEEDEGGPVAPPRGVLIPTFSSSARDELREVPTAIAGKAILAAASLAAGDVGVWHQVKSMVTATRPLLSCRVGIHHRILARIEGRELTVLAVIHRKDLDAAIRRCDRAAAG